MGPAATTAILGFTHKISDNLTFTYLARSATSVSASDDEFGYEHTIIGDVKLYDKYEYVF